ncbi:MAG: VOC family protein [Myxococcaceae bacterium]
MNFANATLAHFSINSDDVARSRTFYEQVFGWKITAWGPPGFYQVEGAGVMGALQARRELLPGQKTLGFECTLAVDSIDETEKRVLANGGKIVLARSVIQGVGTLMFFQEPGGNVFGAMQYEKR